MSSKKNKKKIFIKKSDASVDAVKKSVADIPLETNRRTSQMDVYTFTIRKEVRKRKQIKVIVNNEDVTPKTLDSEQVDFNALGTAHKKQNWKKLKEKLDFSPKQFPEISKASKQSMAYTTKASMDDIIAKISINMVSLDDVPFWRTTSSDNIATIRPKMPPHIKIVLKETDDIPLYHKASITVPKDSDEAKLVEQDNKTYEYLTVGKGKIRRKDDAETQTVDKLFKSRDANTETIKKLHIGSYVSNFEMFDTYKDLEKTTTSVEFDGKQTLAITTYKPGGVDQFSDICKSPNFQLQFMLTQRVLAGNVFQKKQRRFRNMILPDPLSLDVKYLYRLEDLWDFPVQTTERRAVSALCWCPSNGDILAVSYGIFSFMPVKNQTEGFVCIWSIKNPVNPERRYNYSVPVVSIEFSQFIPQLLAVGLYDGTVQVRDISQVSGPPVAISQRITSPGFEPVTALRWIELGAGEDLETEPFLAISRDGTITKYRMIDSPFLSSFQQMKLDRVEGNPEGLTDHKIHTLVESSRHPQAITLTVHPTKKDIYFVLTDEGCMHKCSVNYPHQHIELLKVHDGCVYSMEFSPWSPKLFLTCGSDWCIRLWLEGILSPLMKLSSGIGPVHCAYWSPTHSTIIVGVTRKFIEVWDIRRSILKPVSTKSCGKGSYLTVAKFSNCGRSIIVGNEKGEIYLNAFEDMPFPSYFQYKELEAAILKALMAFPSLTNEVKSIGFWGYPDKM